MGRSMKNEKLPRGNYLYNRALKTKNLKTKSPPIMLLDTLDIQNEYP
jgi:hypothetical protein